MQLYYHFTIVYCRFIVFNKRMITNLQIRAARALLGWSQRELADKSLLSETAILKLETARADSRSSTLIKVRNTFEAVGIEFINRTDGAQGVILKKFD